MRSFWLRGYFMLPRRDGLVVGKWCFFDVYRCRAGYVSPRTCFVFSARLVLYIYLLFTVEKVSYPHGVRNERLAQV